MTKHLFTIAILFFCVHLHAQTWQWAQSTGVQGGNEYATASATDAAGNLYVVGNYNLANVNFGGTLLTNLGGKDFFIVKYDAFGNVQWAKRFGGTKDDIANAIAIDNTGNILVAGNFISTVLSFVTVSLSVTSANFSDIFVAKFDPSGNTLWAKKGTGTGHDGVNAICSDAFDNVFFTGSFSSPTIIFNTSTITKSGTTDALIVKLDMNGNYIWGQHSTGSNSIAIGYGICTDINGSVAATGSYQGNGIDWASTTLPNAGLTDIFITKYTDTGIPLWAKSAGNVDAEEPNGICTDMSGNLFITGHFLSSTLAFGSNAITNSNASTDDIFVVKYDGAGTASWAKSAGGSGNDKSMCITKDAIGNVYVAGSFNSSITFGSTTLTGNGSDDFFMARYSSAGTPGYAKGGGGTSSDVAHSISIDAFNNAYIAGGFLSTSIVLGGTTLTNTDVGDSVPDVFLTKLNSVNAIDDSQTSNLISVFPNPSSGQFEINLPLDASEIKISNAVGEITASISVKGNTKAVFNIKENGIYLIQVFSNQCVINKKLIVNN